MNEEFVTFEIAKKLKEKGVKEVCLCHYIGNDIVYNIESPISNYQMWFCHNKQDNILHRDNIDAPTISQVLKWLREEYTLLLSPCVTADYDDDFRCYNTFWSFIVVNTESSDTIYRDYDRVVEQRYNTYEEAALAGIEYVLDNLI